MKNSKKISYAFIIFLYIVLLFNLFVSNRLKPQITISISLAIYTIVLIYFWGYIKKENAYKKNVIILITIISIIHIVLLYIAGIFSGLYKNPMSFKIKVLFNNIVPYAIVIVCIEIIRNIFLQKKDKKQTIIITVALIIIDALLVKNNYNFKVLKDTLAFAGYVVISSISYNLLGNYIANRYGIIPNIIYRIITTIYIFIFPVLPDIYMFFQITYRIIFPYIIYITIDKLYSTNNFRIARREKTINRVSITISAIMVISLVLLVSCKFRYGIVAVGSSSMSPNINKGDAIIFEKYDNQELKEGQVIIFDLEGIREVHRIKNIQILNNEKIYYTKGDNNQLEDKGYRKSNDIIGVVKAKLIYIGWPTIWVNNLFKN